MSVIKTIDGTMVHEFCVEHNNADSEFWVHPNLKTKNRNNKSDFEWYKSLYRQLIISYWLMTNNVISNK